jgi:general secretion pathway protein F
MASFEYIALDSKGNKKLGNIEADSAKQTRQILKEMGLMPVKVSPFTGKNSSKHKGYSLFKPRLSTLELATITRQLATLVNSAMPIEESLLAIAEQQQKRKIKNVLLAIRSKILEGFNLHSSLEEFPEIFPDMYRATVAAGEHSGYLDKVLLKLAEHTETRMKNAQKVQQAMIYPVILTVVSLCILGFLLGSVVPDIISVFSSSGQSLPTITKLIVSISDGIQKYWHFIILFILGSIFLIRKLLQNPKIKKIWHMLIIKMPVIGRFSLVANAEKFSGTLSLLVQSGVPLVDAIDISAHVISNNVIKEAVVNSTKSVREGTSLHKALAKAKFFPPLMIHMVACGEATGELDNMLAKVSESQNQELEASINILLTLLEPLMLIFMGGMVMTIVLAILLPIFNMNDLIG